MARVKVHVTPDKVILLVLLLLLWGLFAVPFILFHIPQAEQQVSKLNSCKSKWIDIEDREALEFHPPPKKKKKTI